MKHDKLFLIRILCLIGIAGELLIPNNIICMLFGLFFAIISVAFLLMHKNDIILEEIDRKTNYSISIICISVILLLFIIVGYIILKELRVIVLSDSQEIFLSFSCLALWLSLEIALKNFHSISMLVCVYHGH